MVGRIGQVMESGCFKWGVFTAAFLVFWIYGASWLDPDFGWHLRLGEIHLTKGIPETDPFSYTMPSYPFVDYEWLTNVIYYLLYSKIGMVGLSGVYAFLIILATVYLMKGEGRKYWLVPTLLMWVVIIGFFGVRPQVINWVFLMVLLRLLERERDIRLVWVLPLLFLVWVNLHGSYPLGVLVLGLWLVLGVMEKKRINWLRVGAFCFSGLATFINPYGWRNWYEVVVQMGQAGLYRKTIAEWMPIYNKFSMAFVMLVVLSLVLLRRHWERYFWWERVIWVVLGLSAVTSVRNMPLFAIFAAVMVVKGFGYFEESMGKDKEKKRRLGVFWVILVGIAAILVVVESLVAGAQFGKLREETFYPKSAVEFLKREGKARKIIAEYGWGGYLIWKMPGERFFVDGRMPGFVWKAPEGESEQAFLEYLKMGCGELKVNDVFQRYDVGVVILPKPAIEEREVKMRGKDSGFVEELRRVLVYCGTDWSFERSLIDLGWRRVYQDDVAYVYFKPL